MELKQIEQLVDLVASSGVEELSLEAANRRLVIRRCIAAPTPAGHVAVDAPAQPVADRAAVVATEDLPAAEPSQVWITAPMVGIFHPADPPVKEGDRIEPGQVMGVIESMKLMNDMRAEQGGLVREVHIDNGAPVEYGHPLFLIDTAA